MYCSTPSTHRIVFKRTVTEYLFIVTVLPFASLTYFTRMDSWQTHIKICLQQIPVKKVKFKGKKRAYNTPNKRM